MVYHIYHIPGRKYGCTKNYPARPASQSDVYELVETHDDIMIASEREKQLNLEAGYPWMDSQYYHLMVENGSIGGKNVKNRNFSNYNAEDWNAFGRKSGGHNKKLTLNQVNEIKSRYKTERISLHKLGLEYGVSNKTIHKIVRNESYK